MKVQDSPEKVEPIPKSLKHTKILSHMNFNVADKIDDYELQNQNIRTKVSNVPSILAHNMTQTQWNQKYSNTNFEVYVNSNKLSR